MIISLSGAVISLNELSKFYEGKATVRLTEEASEKIERVRAFVEKKLESDEPFYGINTGFGNMANVRISHDDLKKLQDNLIVSHAVAVGDPIPEEIARLVMLLRANVLARGHSGIKLHTIKTLLAMLEKNVVPVIPCQGSVGASGDLAPLAHLALALTGRGEVFYKGQKLSSAKALREVGIEPVELAPKEGIALINGTQVIAAYSIAAHIRAQNLMKLADIAGALSIEGDLASSAPFDARIHALRPHPGQAKTARNILKLVQGSTIVESHRRCGRVQDPYSFRCIPQVHGAVKDAIAWSLEVIIRETGSCTDNPLIFADDDKIISGGNFHGEPLAFAMDLFAIAIAELGSISERRVAVLTTPLSGELPVRSLIENSGLNSGLMTPHVTMASLVSENKVLAHPASVDSIPTFGGQEDHVSMGTFSARKALSIVENVERILAIEIMAACQAIDLQKKKGRPGKGTGAVLDLVRKSIPFATEDREYRLDVGAAHELVKSFKISMLADDICGELEL